MNNKGQSLVLFIALIPVFILIFAFVFDSSLIVSYKTKLKSINNMAIKYVVKYKDDFDMKEYLNKNDSDIKIIKFTNDDGVINLHIQKIIDSYFGKLAGFDTYEINANFIGYMENGVLKIKKG